MTTILIWLLSDWFIVNGSNLRLKGTPLNYETTPVMNITILVLDNGSPPLSYKVRLVTESQYYASMLFS